MMILLADLEPCVYWEDTHEHPVDPSSAPFKLPDQHYALKFYDSQRQILGLESCGFVQIRWIRFNPNLCDPYELNPKPPRTFRSACLNLTSCVDKFFHQVRSRSHILHLERRFSRSR